MLQNFSYIHFCFWFMSVIKLTTVICFFHNLVLKYLAAKEAVKLKGVFFLSVSN